MDGNTIQYEGYLLYPVALPVPPAEKWQALVVISRAHGTGADTTIDTKAFPGPAMMFDTEAEAKEYAIRFGRMLVTGQSKNLPT